MGVKLAVAETIEWYKLKSERNLIYHHIFDVIQFKTEMCQLNFYNCVLDSNKNADALKLNLHKISEECFPLHKSSYCLQPKHFDADCPFQLISKQAHLHKNRLDKKIETCSLWYPSKYSDVNKATYDNHQSNSSKSTFVNKYSIYIPFLLIFIQFSNR